MKCGLGKAIGLYHLWVRLCGLHWYFGPLLMSLLAKNSGRWGIKYWESGIAKYSSSNQDGASLYDGFSYAMGPQQIWVLSCFGKLKRGWRITWLFDEGNLTYIVQLRCALRCNTAYRPNGYSISFMNSVIGMSYLLVCRNDNKIFFFFYIVWLQFGWYKPHRKCK